MLSERERLVLDSLLKHSHRRRYASKACIFRPGDLCDTLHYVVEGSVTIIMPEKSLKKESTHHGKSDQDVVLTHVCRGDFLGEAGFFLGERPYEVTARTRETSVLASINYKRLIQLLNTELSMHACEILLMLGRHLAHRLLQSHRKAANLAVLDVADRISYILTELCEQPDALTHPDGMQIRITRQEIGRMVGCSREMAGRVLRYLETENRIAAKGKTIVVYGTR
ncbi:MAG: cyclic nucleotide-binding domain-containing protein [Methylotetracoccus sp.]|jgi:CRP/FNR family cyclic AMP-dependent transcriptional regulator|nr:cyclic nucleotide-binding domain-containing protein [Methylotetracoccus sp.]